MTAYRPTITVQKQFCGVDFTLLLVSQSHPNGVLMALQRQASQPASRHTLIGCIRLWLHLPARHFSQLVSEAFGVGN